MKNKDNKDKGMSEIILGFQDSTLKAKPGVNFSELVQKPKTKA